MKARVVLEDLADSVPVRQASSSALKEMQGDDLLLFLTSLEELAHFRGKSAVIHILCGRGNLSFLHRSTFFNISPDDYAIIPNAALATDFSASPDLEAIVMALTPAVGSRLALKSNYGIVGHLALLQDPVMRLSIYVVGSGVGAHDVEIVLGGIIEGALDDARRPSISSPPTFSTSTICTPKHTRIGRCPIAPRSFWHVLPTRWLRVLIASIAISPGMAKCSA